MYAFNIGRALRVMMARYEVTQDQIAAKTNKLQSSISRQVNSKHAKTETIEEICNAMDWSLTEMMAEAVQLVESE